MTVSNALRPGAGRAMPPEWRTSPRLVPYPEAVAQMEARVAAIAAGVASEQVWLLEHPPLYTAGTSADPAELLAPDALPVYASGRGGRFTYHGPGQRIAYAMLDLRRRGRDVRRYVFALEDWIIGTLSDLGVRGERRQDRVGIWFAHPDGREEKVAAIGVRVRRWVAYHGIAINVDLDLRRFAGIVPCGIREHGVTSLAALGIRTSMAGVDEALRRNFATAFGDS